MALPSKTPALLLTALAFALMIPAASASSFLQLDDPAGDVGVLPCAPAVDITRVTAEWTTDGIALTYTYVDLGAMEPAMLLQDLAGRCMYHYTEFETTRDGQVHADAVYFDHSSNPAFETGWRFYLHESGVPLEGDVDIAADTITVHIPDEVLGGGVGDTFRIVRVQSTTALTGAGVDYQSDFVPEGDCACTLTYPQAPAGSGVEANAAAAEDTGGSDLSPFWLTPLALVGLVRRVRP